jgi:8-oxo-dGTP pyrophosphatase MutT (NUDIX family)
MSRPRSRSCARRRLGIATELSGDLPRVVRRAARLLVLDLDGAPLLIRGLDPARPDAGSWWFTPGGGLEPGETFAAAARRELTEETGAVAEHVVPLPGERTAEFALDGVFLVQTERYFSVRLPRFDPVATELTDLELRSHLESRWWTQEEFAEEAPLAFPEDLADVWRAAARLTAL